MQEDGQQRAQGLRAGALGLRRSSRARAQAQAGATCGRMRGYTMRLNMKLHISVVVFFESSIRLLVLGASFLSHSDQARGCAYARAGARVCACAYARICRGALVAVAMLAWLLSAVTVPGAVRIVHGLRFFGVAPVVLLRGVRCSSARIVGGSRWQPVTTRARITGSANFFLKFLRFSCILYLT